MHNPKRPLGDITGAVKRTLLRPKEEGEAVTFNVPQLVTEELWQTANDTLRRRGRGRGKQGRTIQALLRNRIFCPRCGKPMVVRRKSRQEKVYYYCPRYYHSWTQNRCGFHSFVPGGWDDSVWDCVCALLVQDSWVEDYIGTTQNQVESVDKLIKLEERKISQAKAKIGKIREGYEAAIYSLEETKARIAGCQDTILKAELETKRIRKQIDSISAKPIDTEALRQELGKLAQRNMEEATFEEKRDIIDKLGIRVYPSEDLKSVRIKCGLCLNLDGNGDTADTDGCRIIMFGLLS